MATFECHDYRQAIKARIKTLQAQGQTINLRRIAMKIPVQYTFLSKCLNDPVTHLSEDHTYRACELLDFLPDEAEFVLLLRARDVTRLPSRKAELTRLIEKKRQKQVIRAEHHEHASSVPALEMDYLLDPITVIVRTALFLDNYQKAPGRLCTALGIQPEHLKQILEKLERVGFIQVDAETQKLTLLERKPQHWSRQHPLMRAHQMGMKLHLLNRLRLVNEDDKDSFFATFTMDEAHFKKAKQLLRDTLRSIQELSEKSSNSHLYQLSFDLAKILA